jgi:cell division protein FtsB
MKDHADGTIPLAAHIKEVTAMRRVNDQLRRDLAAEQQAHGHTAAENVRLRARIEHLETALGR